MLFKNKIAAFIVFLASFRSVVGDPPYFRILAPAFVCPNDEEAMIKKPDNTVITVKTDASDLHLSWMVRWALLDKPSQRFTLLLWKTVRTLEVKLNGPQPEPFVYIIDNVELLQGVEYVFYVTGSRDGSENVTQSFAIDNIKGDPKLMIEGRSDKFSVLLVGAEVVYINMEYVLEAVVTTCTPTQDYYFVWSVQSASAHPLNVSSTSGSRLEIPPYSLQAGGGYYVTCTVYRYSHEFVTQTGLPFQVLYRGLAVNLNVDFLVITANNAFNVIALVENHDYFTEVPEFQWRCIYENERCENFESVDNKTLTFPNGLPNIGRYEITLTAKIIDQQASTNATFDVVEHTLPLIEIQPHHRTINEYSLVTLTANASNLTPTCTLTWYFSNNLTTLDNNGTCDDCQHGVALSGSVTIFSLEENFLDELTDFTNETEWRQVTTEMEATSGRARFIAQCSCSLTFSCETQGIVHGDVNFELNESPKGAEIKVSPENGTAMETVFRLSTLAASDTERPLRYAFYCSLGTNDTLLLGSNLEQLAVETFLPYVGETGIDTWVEVCDSLGACSTSEVITVQLMAGEGRTINALVDSMRGHVARCEMLLLRRLVESAVTTYTKSDQRETLSEFTNDLLKTLPTTEENVCKDSRDYITLLDWLILAGVDISSLYG